MNTTKMNVRFLPVLLGLVCAAPAMFMRPDWVPVDRLVRNTARYVETHPTDAAGYYTLGRLHYLAFTLKMELVPAFPQRDDNLVRPVPDHLAGLPLAGAREQRAIQLAQEELGVKADAPDERQRFFQAVSRHRKNLEAENWAPPPVRPEALVEHAEKSVAALRKATELDPKDSLFPLCQGSLLVQFADWNDEARLANLPDALQGDLRLSARGFFLKAWKLAEPGESKATSLPVGGLSQFVSFEAGHAFLRLAEADPQSLSPGEKEVIPKIKAGVAALEKLPVGAITPLVLSLHPRPRLSDMLAPGAAVQFDMTGCGRGERWSWISPELGLLVWDPLDRRDIASGRQLFGNFTFQGIWRNGFEALRALDDNGDGRIARGELIGVALWCDRDGDGHSIGSEVVPLETLGIDALSCEATAYDGVHLVNRVGASFTDGCTVPVWDWVAAPAQFEHAP